MPAFSQKTKSFTPAAAGYHSPAIRRLASTALRQATAVVLIAVPLRFAAANDWYPSGAKPIDEWAECLQAADPDQRAEACTAILGDARDQHATIRALNGRGNALCASADRCAEAVADFTAVVRLAPDVAGYHDNLARALRAAGRYEEALQQSDKAITLAPRLAFVWIGKARTLELAGRTAEALETVQTAMTIEPPGAGSLEYQGKLLGALKRFSESHAAFDHALQLQPARASVFVRRADLEIAEGRDDDAIRDLERYPSDGAEAKQVGDRLRALRSAHIRRLMGSDIPAELIHPKAAGAKPPAPLDGWHGNVSTDTAASISTTGQSCNLHDWVPVQRCIEEYHNENDPLPGGVINPRHWNEELASQGRSVVERHPEITTWNRAAWNKLVAEATALARADEVPQEEPGLPETSPESAEPPSPAPAAPPPTGAIDTCDAPGVLSVIRKLSEKALKEQAFMLLLGNVVGAHFEYAGIRQLSYDPEGEHRFCVMDRKLAVTYYAGTRRPPANLDSPIRYQIDRRLDGDRGSYVTCRCDR